MFEFLLACLGSFVAGGIDAMVGGGGLILVPALFALYPTAPPPTLLGTNKSASIWGTSWASWQFAQRVQLPWHMLWPATTAALLASFAGAWTVTLFSALILRLALPFVLSLILIYTLFKKDLGLHHAPRHSKNTEGLLGTAIGGVIGFYDGFFGPGTGSFFVFLLVRVLGYDFLNASASAKLLNAATNLAAIALFAWKGHVWWHLGLSLALCNVLGSLLGTRLALKHGAPLVRGLFIVVVAALIAKTTWDAFFKT